MKKKNAATVLLLSLITLGIYGVVWIWNFSGECKKTGAVSVNIPRLFQPFVYACSMLALAALVLCLVTRQSDTLMYTFAGFLVFFRIADGILIGTAQNSQMRQIRKRFGMTDKSYAFIWIITGIVVPFVTVALAQSAFNEVEDIACKLEKSSKNLTAKI